MICFLHNKSNFMVLHSKVDFEKEIKYAHLFLLCSNISISFLKPQAILWNFCCYISSQILPTYMTLTETSFVDARFLLSILWTLLFSNLCQAKSIACLFKNLILRSVIINPFLSTRFSFFTTNMLSERGPLYSFKTRGFALIALNVSESRTYSPSKHLTLLTATYICP